ncbi:MAG: hypothetical protein RI953_503 [Pseudomonadota bacterium]
MKNVMLLSGISLLAVVASACGKKDDDGGATTTGSFITPATFTSVTPTALTVDEVKYEIGNSSELYDNKPTSGTTTPTSDTNVPPGPFEECFTQSEPKVKIVAKETINVSADINVMECVRGKPVPAGQTAPAASDVFAVKAVINITCPGADLTSLEGKSISEIGFDNDSSGVPSGLEEKCKDLPSIKIFTNSEFQMALTSTYQNQSFSFSMKSKDALFNKDGAGCELVKVDGGYKMNGCLQASVIESERPDMATGKSEKKTNLTILEATELIDLAAGTATWFNGGSFKATFNNFTGIVNYNNSTTAPTYTLTAAGGLSASGTVEKVSSFPGDTSGNGGSDSTTFNLGRLEMRTPDAKMFAANPFAAAQRYVKSLSKLRPGSIR